jgi:hypothetical protein
MQLRHDWQWIVTRAWSVRWMAIAAALSGIEVVLPMFADDPPLPRGYFSILSGLAVAGAFVSRIVAQRRPDGEVPPK